jgi:hypothetical protein
MHRPDEIPNTERPIESDLTPWVMSRIRGASRLIDVYGVWPSFEDAEIVSVALDRGNHQEVVVTRNWAARVPPSLTAKVIVFDARYGDVPKRKYRLVTLRFIGISRFNMGLFGDQNPVMGIGLRAESPADTGAGPNIHVQWGGTVMGHEADFICESIDVQSVEPFDPAESPSS